MKSRFLQHALNWFCIVVHIHHIFCEFSENTILCVGCSTESAKKVYDAHTLNTYENIH